MAETPVSSLKLLSRNPRRISKEALARLSESITRDPEFMRLRPIVVDADGVVLGGNQRLRACKALGMKVLPDGWVVQAANLTEEQRKRFILVDNAPQGMAGEWDDDILKADWGLDELKGLGFDFGEDAPETDADAEPQVDRAEELREKWATERGQLWRIGDHRLLCGDSTNAEDVGRLMGGERATCVFTDPPYGVSIGRKNEMLNSVQKAGCCLASLDADDMTPEQLKDVLLAAFRTAREHMADDCSVFVCSPQGGGLWMMMMMMMQEACLEVRHILNWVKNSPTFSLGRLDYDYQHEPILFTWMKTHKRRKAGQWQTSLWACDKPRSSKEHPTMKPVELPTNAIKNHTDPGDIVMDIFGGSGTTMVAAQNTGRRGRLLEISPGFTAVILERMVTAFPELDIHKL